jgi:hypothetical protein
MNVVLVSPEQNRKSLISAKGRESLPSHSLEAVTSLVETVMNAAEAVLSHKLF